MPLMQLFADATKVVQLRVAVFWQRKKPVISPVYAAQLNKLLEHQFSRLCEMDTGSLTTEQAQQHHLIMTLYKQGLTLWQQYKEMTIGALYDVSMSDSKYAAFVQQIESLLLEPWLRLTLSARFGINESTVLDYDKNISKLLTSLTQLTQAELERSQASDSQVKLQYPAKSLVESYQASFREICSESFSFGYAKSTLLLQYCGYAVTSADEEQVSIELVANAVYDSVQEPQLEFEANRLAQFFPVIDNVLNALPNWQRDDRPHEIACILLSNPCQSLMNQYLFPLLDDPMKAELVYQLAVVKDQVQIYSEWLNRQDGASDAIRIVQDGASDATHIVHDGPSEAIPTAQYTKPQIHNMHVSFSVILSKCFQHYQLLRPKATPDLYETPLTVFSRVKQSWQAKPGAGFMSHVLALYYNIIEFFTDRNKRLRLVDRLLSHYKTEPGPHEATEHDWVSGGKLGVLLDYTSRVRDKTADINTDMLAKTLEMSPQQLKSTSGELKTSI